MYISQAQIGLTTSVLASNEGPINVPLMINDGQWHTVDVLINATSASLSVDGQTSISYNTMVLNTTMITYPVSVFLGGTETPG